MNVYFLILICCLVGSIYSNYEKFIETVECDPNSICVTNTEYSDGYKNKFDGPPTHNLSYVCLKKKYQWSNCTKLGWYAVIKHSGCYYNEYTSSKELKFERNKHFHLFALRKPLECRQFSPYRVYDLAFGFHERKSGYKYYAPQHSWFLVTGSMDVRISNNSEENFDEFFTDNSPAPTTETTETKEKNDTQPRTTIESKPPLIRKMTIVLIVVQVIMIIVFVTASVIFYRRFLRDELKNE